MMETNDIPTPRYVQFTRGADGYVSERHIQYKLRYVMVSVHSDWRGNSLRIRGHDVEPEEYALFMHVLSEAREWLIMENLQWESEAQKRGIDVFDNGDGATKYKSEYVVGSSFGGASGPVANFSGAVRSITDASEEDVAANAPLNEDTDDEKDS